MWLSKDKYEKMQRRLEVMEGQLDEGYGDSPSTSDYLWGQQPTLAGRIKRLERQHDQLRKDFDLLTQHLKVRKTTTSEVTRFSPCKKRK